MTVWEPGSLRSPVSGAVLTADTPHSLTAPGERWPVVEDVPFLRADRRDLAAAAVSALDSGRPAVALALMLADQDNWARSAPPDEASRQHLVTHAATLSFREAMDLLAYGPVATYFAHRWSDPTFMSGLALAEAHAAPAPMFELACGAGHYLREFGRDGTMACGGDIVFSKLWLARRFIAPSARLVCFDAAAAWPFSDAAFGTVFCHDAFYFLPHKPHVAAEMRRVASSVLLGHAHNALVDNLSSGEPLPPDAYAELFPGSVMYDDRELTQAVLETRAPVPATMVALAGAPAISLAYAAGPPRPLGTGLSVPADGTWLRRNPLYSNGRIAWPSPRYEAEYGPLATYPMQATGPETAIAGRDAGIAAAARCRELLDLPASW